MTTEHLEYEFYCYIKILVFRTQIGVNNFNAFQLIFYFFTVLIFSRIHRRKYQDKYKKDTTGIKQQLQ